MSSIKLPIDTNALQQVQSFVKRRRQTIKQSFNKIEKFKEQLDEEVAQIYGLQESIDVIRNALKVIGGDISPEGD